MRDLGEVLDKMLDVVPLDAEMRPALEDLRGSVRYAAPEQDVFWWNRVGEFLQSDLGDPALFTEQWQRSVADIFMDRKVVV